MPKKNSLDKQVAEALRELDKAYKAKSAERRQLKLGARCFGVQPLKASSLRTVTDVYNALADRDPLASSNRQASKRNALCKIYVIAYEIRTGWATNMELLKTLVEDHQQIITYIHASPEFLLMQLLIQVCQGVLLEEFSSGFFLNLTGAGVDCGRVEASTIEEMFIKLLSEDGCLSKEKIADLKADLNDGGKMLLVKKVSEFEENRQPSSPRANDEQSLIGTSKARNWTSVVPVLRENGHTQNKGPVLNQTQNPPTNHSMQADPLSSDGLRQRPPHAGQNMPSLPRQPISQSGRSQFADRSGDFRFREAPSQVSIKDIITETGASLEELNKKIQDVHLNRLASKFKSVHTLGDCLKLNRQVIENITKKHENRESQCKEALRMWRRNNGSKASYYRLAQVCLEHFRSADLATIICQLSKGEIQSSSNGGSGGLTRILYNNCWIIAIFIVVILLFGGALLWYTSQSTGNKVTQTVSVKSSLNAKTSVTTDHPHVVEVSVKDEKVVYVNNDQSLSGTIINPDSRPTMPELRSFKLSSGHSIDIVQKIAGQSCSRRFGVLLLEDETEVNIIENDYRRVERIVDAIMGRWLSGRGKSPVTWRTLVSVLKEVQLDVLVKQIRGQFN